MGIPEWGKERPSVEEGRSKMIFEFDRDFDWDEYTYHLIRPHESIPQVRLFRGQIIPTLSEETIAASATRAVVLWSIGMSTRSYVASYLAQRYTMPMQTQFLFAFAFLGIGAASAVGIHTGSTVLDKHAALGGVSVGSDQSRRIASLGGMR